MPVELEAGVVRAEPPYDTWELERDVEIRRGRHVVRSERLRVEAREDEDGGSTWHVEGEGSIATCPCDDPPVAWGFDGAEIHPGGDVVLYDPTLLAFGAPVLWLPALWVRAPDRVGLLPPFVEFRTEEGLLAGGGLFVPVPSLDDGVLEVRAGGYTTGGFVAGARLASAHARAEATWDRAGGDRIAVASVGGVEPDIAEPPFALTWDVDLIRGDRAVRGTRELEPAARPFDQGRVDVAMSPVERTRLEATVDALGQRGGTESLAIGPGVAGHRAGELGTTGRWELGAAALSLARSEGATSLGLLEARLAQAPPLQPLQLDLDVRGRLQASDAPLADASAAGLGQVGAVVRLPFARRFGGAPDAWVHTVTPLVDARVILHGEEVSARREDTAIAAAGLDSWLTRWPGAGLRVELRGGVVAGQPGDPVGAGHARWELDAHAFALSMEAAGVLPDDDTRGGGAVRGGSRLGPALGPTLSVDATGRAGRATGEARLLGDRERLPGDPLGYVVRRGLTGGAEVSLPLGRTLVASTRLDGDAREGQLVGSAGALGYQHPCGCLDARLFASQRVGRRGFDAGLVLDLFPAAPP